MRNLGTGEIAGSPDGDGERHMRRVTVVVETMRERR